MVLEDVVPVVVAVVAVVVVVVVPLPPLQLVADGAGQKDEEAELTGDGSMEEAESMQRAESRELTEPSRLVVVVLDWRCALIQGCWRHMSAVSLVLWVGGREGVREEGGREE